MIELCGKRPGGLLTLALAWVTAACSATTGNQWVEQPEDGAACPGGICPAESTVEALPSPANDPELGQATQPEVSRRPASDRPREPARRLDRTVTLGSTQALADDVPPATQPPAQAPVVIVNQQPPAPQYGYGGYVYGGWVTQGPRTFRGSVGASPSPGASPSIGQNWPTVPSYGPPFPYRTAPASPWQPAR